MRVMQRIACALRDAHATAGALAAALIVGGGLGACGDTPQPVMNGDAVRGRLLLHQYPCADCHRIPGVPTAEGTVGPPLDSVARRVYLAGTLPNSPEHMVRWIRDPQAVKPRTNMPNLRVPQQHAADMVAYLYTLP